MQSIIQNRKECFVCKRTSCLEEHHIMNGFNRSNSEKYGLKVWLCHAHHNEPPNGVHYNQKFDEELKRIAEKKFLDTHTFEEYMSIFGKNYL